MKVKHLFLLACCVLIFALLAACKEQPNAAVATQIPEVTAQSEQPTPEAAETSPMASGSAPEFQGQPLSFEKDSLFTAAGVCAGCHSNMTDESGADVSIDRMWRATMMANAARDPYWTASVQAEVLDAPELRQVIEDKCATCHMPMTSASAHAAGQQGRVLDDGGWLNPDSQGHALAMEGISCNLCHQIEPDNFGLEESFSGGYQIDLGKPAGERISFGPFAVEETLAKTMQSSSGFIPEQSDHLAQSEMCATCHTLYTPYLDASNKVAGQFPEQMPYQEWLNSSYKNEQSCQDCHMPIAQGGVQISILSSPERSPFLQHSFLGGNAYMLRIFRSFGESLGVTASSQNFDDLIAATVKYLQEEAASVTLDMLTVQNGELTGQVKVDNLTGHKFPTSFPSRRAWLHIVVQDAAGQIVFETGAVNPDGSIVGNDNDVDPSSFEPHYLEINSSQQVQIYEPIMVDTEGQVTTIVLRGSAYAKDNRLLPAGFDLAAAGPEIAVYGLAVQDKDFSPGGDVLQLAIDLGSSTGPYSVTVELLYESIGYRWAQNLSRHTESGLVADFLGFYKAVDNLPVIIATAQSEVK
jgi:hypothetical protein